MVAALLSDLVTDFQSALGRTGTGGGLNRGPVLLSGTNQLLEIVCTTWDLGIRPDPDCTA
jgi:hypothetical protein